MPSCVSRGSRSMMGLAAAHGAWGPSKGPDLAGGCSTGWGFPDSRRPSCLRAGQSPGWAPASCRNPHLCGVRTCAHKA